MVGRSFLPAQVARGLGRVRSWWNSGISPSTCAPTGISVRMNWTRCATSCTGESRAAKRQPSTSSESASRLFRGGKLQRGPVNPAGWILTKYRQCLTYDRSFSETFQVPSMKTGYITSYALVTLNGHQNNSCKSKATCPAGPAPWLTSPVCLACLSTAWLSLLTPCAVTLQTRRGAAS